jgi:PIN domain nuclease of toxin-antitoxin system
MNALLDTHTLSPDLHRDPFDRIIVAQSQVTGMPILTIDRLIAQYDIEIIW